MLERCVSYKIDIILFSYNDIHVNRNNCKIDNLNEPSLKLKEINFKFLHEWLTELEFSPNKATELFNDFNIICSEMLLNDFLGYVDEINIEGKETYNSRSPMTSNSNIDSHSSVHVSASSSSLVNVRTTPDQSKGPGRPKNTTKTDQYQKHQNIILAKNEIMEVLLKKKRNCGKLPYRAVSKLVKDVNEKFKFQGEDCIKINTIRSHFYKEERSTFVVNEGNSSPLMRVEKVAVELLCKCGEMNAPLNCTQGLELIRSLVNKDEMRDNIYSWIRHNCHPKNGDVLIGQGYWRNFLKRNKFLL